MDFVVFGVIFLLLLFGYANSLLYFLFGFAVYYSIPLLYFVSLTYLNLIQSHRNLPSYKFYDRIFIWPALPFIFIFLLVKFSINSSAKYIAIYLDKREKHE